jgi:hypothetical protein
MSFRRVTRAARVSVLASALAGSVSLLAFASPAWALSSGSQVPNAAQCNPAALKPTGGAEGPCAAQPFSSGQIISVVVPGNAVWGSGASIKIIECSAAVVSVTSDAAALPLCDGLTIQGDTILAAADGSINYGNYTVYALPDTFSLAESASGTPVCNTSNPCVLYIGADQTHPFSSAHVWSQNWLVQPFANDTGYTNPGDGTPEAPLAIGLPLLAVGLVGGTLFVRRRRASKA